MVPYGNLITPANVLALPHAYITSASRSPGFGDKNRNLVCTNDDYNRCFMILHCRSTMTRTYNGCQKCVKFLCYL